MSKDPYAPPAASPSEPVPSIDRCPGCGASLERGKVTGTLHWLPEDATAMDRFIGGSKVVGPRSFSLTLHQSAAAAMRCPACQLILVSGTR